MLTDLIASPRTIRFRAERVDATAGSPRIVPTARWDVKQTRSSRVLLCWSGYRPRVHWPAV